MKLEINETQVIIENKYASLKKLIINLYNVCNDYERTRMIVNEIKHELNRIEELLDNTNVDYEN